MIKCEVCNVQIRDSKEMEAHRQTEEHRARTKTLKSQKEAKKEAAKGQKGEVSAQEKVKSNQQGSSSNKNRGKKADALCD